MAKKPNYGFLKNQKDMKRKKKQEEKRLRRQNKTNAPSDTTPPAVPQDSNII